MTNRIAIIIRHGDYHQLPDTPSAHQPFPLNEDGQAQAKKAINLIQNMVASEGWGLDPIIHSSNLLRSWQTADIIRDGLSGIEGINGFDDLAERGVGSAANLSLSQIEQILKKDPRFENPPENWKSNSNYCLPLQGAESLMDAGIRVADHMKHAMDTINTSPDGTIAKIIVGHGAAFRHAAHKLGVLDFEDIAKLSMYHATPVALRYDMKNNKWSHVLGQWKIRAPKDRHLD